MFIALRNAALAAALVCFCPLALADACVDCHRDETRNIVVDWQISRHYSENVGCSDCHKGRHSSADDVDKLRTVTAQTCAKCHEERFEQFAKGKHALAWTAVEAMPTTHALPMALSSGMKGCGGCHKLGLKVVAEGVEKQEDWDLISDLHCDEGQGFFIAKPMPGDRIPSWLRHWNSCLGRG